MTGFWWLAAAGMLPVALSAQQVDSIRLTGLPHSASSPQPMYSTPALAAVVARAAVENHRPPPALQSYHSRIETEIALLVRDTLGREHTAEVEQVATDATWRRDGLYDFHIVGYRSQSVGVPYSALSIVRAWTVPSLYGERLRLGVYGAGTRSGRDSINAVHPFAADRDQYYRFSGGDTVAVLRAGDRAIPIVRVRVHPELTGATPLAAFDGEIDLDATRWQIVRMRGRFVIAGVRETRSAAIARRLGLVSVAYVEFVNAEIDGTYWLPAFQRTEFQAAFPLLGAVRPVIRLVSNISRISVVDGGRVEADTMDMSRVVATWAPADSVRRFGDWERGLGVASGDVHADDWNDLAPDVWRPNGGLRFNLLPLNTARILRFNRVEGLYTGLSPSIDFRDLAPGLTVGASAGYAWSERTVRGGGSLSYTRGQTIYAARAERLLASTNDFAPPLSEDAGFGALLGSVDDYDYVDRRNALVSVTRVLGSVDAGLATLQIGAGNDRGERARLSHGLIPAGDGFRLNRGAATGSYAIGIADVEVHPNVTGDFVQPGIGGRLHYEGATGDLTWQRIELGLSSRQYVGPVSFAMHADGGAVIGAKPPPQTLFELGGNELLPGYAYKQFAGDRAVLLRAFASYRFHTGERPIRIRPNLVIPGINPGIAASVQGGWTELSSLGARAAARELGLDAAGAPLSNATHGARATVGAGLTFFADALHIGVARPVDHSAPFKLVIGFGTAF